MANSSRVVTFPRYSPALYRILATLDGAELLQDLLNPTSGFFTTLQLKEFINGSSIIVSKTANYTILSTDVGTCFDNTGAAGEVDFTLPAWSVGLRFSFVVTSAHILKVKMPGVAKVAVGSVNSAAGGSATGSTVYSAISLFASSISNQWVADSATGSWAVA